MASYTMMIADVEAKIELLRQALEELKIRLTNLEKNLNASPIKGEEQGKEE